MSVSELDGALWEQVTHRLSHPDTIADELRQAWHEADALTEADLQALDRRAASVTTKQRRLTQAVARLDDEAAVAPLLAELQTLGAEQAALSKEREALRDRIDTRASHERLIAELEDGLAWWQHMRQDRLERMPVATRRTILTLLDVTVRLYPKGHEPRYDVTAAIPLDVPHHLNELWTEVTERPIRLDFSQTQPPVPQQDATPDNQHQLTYADSTPADLYLSGPCADTAGGRARPGKSGRRGRSPS
jgi:hypothetical protein